MVEYNKFDNQTIYYKSSENMSEIEDDTIDVIVTSPPYNRNKHYSDDLGLVYNDKKPQDEYFNFLSRVWRECYRVLNPRGIFFLNIGDSASDQGLSEQVVKLACNVGFHRLQTIIWIKSLLGKGHYTPTGGKKRLNNLWENIFVLIKNKMKYRMYPKAIGIPFADKSNIGRYGDEDLRDAGNVWLINYSKTTGATIKKGHEAPFPIELPYKCIKLAGGETVLDPFAGTGTTLAAARVLEKVGFGYEKFPRKMVLRKKILESSFVPRPVTLLPHLELTTEILSFFSKNLDFNHLQDKGLFRFSKKESTQISILRDVLTNQGLSLPFLDEYFNFYNKKTKISSKSQTSLQQFLPSKLKKP
jgi:site-specific DNA-methyltransferase (adenine-specific)